jgi:hypothetical protein
MKSHQTPGPIRVKLGSFAPTCHIVLEFIRDWSARALFGRLIGNERLAIVELPAFSVFLPLDPFRRNSCLDLLIDGGDPYAKIHSGHPNSIAGNPVDLKLASESGGLSMIRVARRVVTGWICCIPADAQPKSSLW